MKRFLTIADVIMMVALSKSSIYRLLDAKLFPKSIPLSPRRIAWDYDDIIEWMELKKAEKYKYWE